MEPNPEIQSRRRSIYLLPNLFTTGGLFGGFFAIIAASQGRFERRARFASAEAIQPVAEFGQGLALERIPVHPARFRHSHCTGPDSAYSTAAASSTLGGSSTSAMITASAITIAKNGTRSALGPLPLPLKLV